MEFITGPVHSFTMDPLQCNCGGLRKCSIGKHPKHNWRNQTVSIPHNEGEGYYILTGVKGLFVIDIDSEEPEATLVAIAGGRAFPKTRIVRTGKGGLHIYFTAPEWFVVPSTVGRFMPKVDTRGHKAIVIGPGSPHISGKSYTLEIDAEPAEAPPWLLLELQNRLGTMAEPVKHEGKLLSVEVTPDMEHAAIHYLTQLAPASILHHGGDAAAWDVALKLMCEFQLPLEKAMALWIEHYNPRCSDPWEDGQLYHKLYDAGTKGTRNRGCAQLKFPIPPPRPPIDISESKSLRRVSNPKHRYNFDSGVEKNPGVVKIHPGDLLSTVQILREDPEWTGVFQYDEFADCVRAVNPPMPLAAEQVTGLSDDDLTSVRIYLQTRHSKNCTAQLVFDAIQRVARQNSYNPIQDYLESLPEGNPEFLFNAAKQLFANEEEQSTEWFIKWLVSAVARALLPGCKADCMLVLISQTQGFHKSSFFQLMFGEWYSEQMPSLNKSSDASLALSGVWCMEFSEFDSLIKLDPAEIKAFLSRVEDRYRPPYGRCMVQRKRRVVFGGSTNRDDFHVDMTGNRRVWHILVNKPIPKAWIRANRDKLWAAAYAVFRIALADIQANVPDDEVRGRWWLSTREEMLAEVIRQDMYIGDAWEAPVERVITEMKLKGVQEFTMHDVLYSLCLKTGESILRMGRAQQMRVGAILKKFGCEKLRSSIKRSWKFPDSKIENPE